MAAPAATISTSTALGSGFGESSEWGFGFGGLFSGWELAEKIDGCGGDDCYRSLEGVFGVGRDLLHAADFAAILTGGGDDFFFSGGGFKPPQRCDISAHVFTIDHGFERRSISLVVDECRSRSFGLFCPTNGDE